MRLSEHEWAVAKEVCTGQQLRALDLWRRGAGKKRIALVLNVHPSTARDHVHAGLANIAKALEEQAV